MAVIDNVGKLQQDVFGVGDAFEPMIDWFRALVAADMWNWYDLHSNDNLITVGFWVFTKSLKVRHCKPLFIKLFGEHP